MIEDGWRDDEIIERYGQKAIVWEVGVDFWLSDPPDRRRFAALIAEVRTIRAGSEPEPEPPARPWTTANRARSAAARERATEARALHADHWTVDQIMAKQGKTRRTVEGYLKEGG